MRHEPGIIEREDPATVAAMDARASADAQAGRYHPHTIVRERFTTFGDADFKPFQAWLAERNG